VFHWVLLVVHWLPLVLIDAHWFVIGFHWLFNSSRWFSIALIGCHYVSNGFHCLSLVFIVSLVSHWCSLVFLWLSYGFHV
jgi:hypothetical protein